MKNLKNGLKQTLITIIVALLFSLQLSAQTLSGNVGDEQGNPVEFANILLLTPQDSSFIARVASNESGDFNFQDIKFNQAVIQVSAIGYQTFVQNITLDDFPIVVKLYFSTIGLQDVVIEANRINRSAKGYAINLAGSELSKGKTAIEAITFLPGISRENNTLKINGLTVSEVYLNDVKLSNWNELDNIAGEYLWNAEVEYFAGSDKNASLTGGIIKQNQTINTQ